MFLFLLTSIFTDDITLVMNFYWIDSLLTATLRLKLSVSSSSTKQARWRCYSCHNKCLICIWPQVCSCYDVSPQVSSVKAGRWKIRVRWQEFVRVVHVFNMMELSSSSLLYNIASPENPNSGCCVATPERLFDEQHWWATSIMFLSWFKDSCLPRFSLTTNQPKYHNLSPFLVETAACEFFIAELHHYSCLCINDIT